MDDVLILNNYDSVHENAVFIEGFEIKYWQRPDCEEDSNGNGQTLKVKFHNNGVDWFMSLDTCGTRWSIDEPEAILAILNDAKKRFYLDKEDRTGKKQKNENTED